jgi:cobalamin biosynthesis protein CobD/CbiB
VVLAGKVISIVTKRIIPNRVYQSRTLGLVAGTAFLVGMLSLFWLGGEMFLFCSDQIVRLTLNANCNNAEIICYNNSLFVDSAEFVLWVLEVALVETTFSLQLLCTIALQMAKFLERHQIDESRCQLSWLCSRDPSDLNKEELAGATLESLSVSS